MNKEQQKNTVLILLSDPDPFLVRVYKNKFKKEEGWDTVTISKSKDVLENIKKEKPAVILADIIFPDGNMFDVLKEIKTSDDKSISSIPVIILTDLSQESDRKKALDLGAIEYLIKGDVSFGSVLEKTKEIIVKRKLKK